MSVYYPINKDSTEEQSPTTEFACGDDEKISGESTVKEGGQALPHMSNMFETMSIDNMPLYHGEQIIPTAGLKHMNSQKLDQ
jgi:hypothetical protein